MPLHVQAMCLEVDYDPAGGLSLTIEALPAPEANNETAAGNGAAGYSAYPRWLPPCCWQAQVFAAGESPRGVIVGVASEPGQFMRLLHVTVSSDGLFYVSDEPNRRVQVFRLLQPLVSTPASLVLR